MKRKVFFAAVIILLLIGSNTVFAELTGNIPGGIDIPKENQVFSLNSKDNCIEGWAISTEGIERVEILVNGNIVGTAKYGEERDDVGKAYPDIPTSNKSGYKYYFKKDDLKEGVENLSVKVTSKSGNYALFGPIKVNVSKINLALGGIDVPVDNTVTSIFKEEIRVVGWCVDPNGVDRIEIYLDNMLVGKGEYGSIREDVKNAFPDIKDSLMSGFYHSIKLNGTSSGKHIIAIKEYSKDGTSKEIGNRIVIKKSRVVFSIWLLIFIFLMFLLYKILKKEEIIKN